MHCSHCGFENPLGMKFCGQCATALARICGQCQFENPSAFLYCGNCAAALDTAAVLKPTVITGARSEPERDSRPMPHQDAERRQITVLFCDLVGSSALSERMDPEDLREVMRIYRTACSGVISKYDGFIAQYLGDGVLAYFGYPQAAEDDAHRAVLAALELIATINGLQQKLRSNPPLTLSMRAGVHTGMVVVSNTTSRNGDGLALGDAPNITARLQDLAEPNTVIISGATHRLIHRYFECESRGAQALKGFSRPIDIYRVIARQAHDGRMTALQLSDISPLVGREQEAGLLLDRLDKACSGAGQIVLLSGDAGLGKSRLATLVRTHMKSREHHLLECWGSLHYKNSYLFPIIGLLRRVMQLDASKSDEQRLRQLEEKLAMWNVPAVSVPLFADLLSIPLPVGRYAPIALSPQQKKSKTMEVLVSLLQTLAYDRMVLLIVEDLHWVDPSTLELLAALIDGGPMKNMFALLTFRSEFAPSWASHPKVSKITLNRLTRQQSGRMIRWLAKGKTLPLEVFRQISEKTDGVPIFIEELTKMVLESSMLEEHENHYALTRPTEELRIPSTLQDSLMARLDQLGAEKELVQLGATIGREFLFSVLHAIVPGDEQQLETKLARLVNCDMLLRQGMAPDTSYTFNHALVQDAAYQSLLRSTRQHYHTLIAQTLVQKFPRLVSANPELAAYHFTEGGMINEGVAYWLAAGRTALRRYANQEALAHLKKGLDLIQTLPHTTRRTEIELDFLLSQGLAAMMVKGYAAKEVEESFARAHQLCRSLGEIPSAGSVNCGLWEYYIVRAEFEIAQEIAQRIHADATKSREAILLQEANRIMGSTLFWRGEFTAALDYLTRDADAAVTHAATDYYSQDTQVSTLSNLGCVLWLTGHPDQALEKAQQAVQLAQQLEHPFSQAYAQTFLTIVHQLRGDRPSVLSSAQAGVAIAQQYGFAFWLALARMLEAWAQTEFTPVDECIKLFDQARSAYSASGGRLAQSYLNVMLAQLHQQADQPEQALAIVDLAISESESRDEGFFLAELYRLKGVLHGALCRPSATAEELLTRSLAISRAQQARSLELRAALDLGDVLQAQGQVDEARHIIDSAAAPITEGRHTHDMVQARDLLERLAARP